MHGQTLLPGLAIVDLLAGRETVAVRMNPAWLASVCHDATCPVRIIMIRNKRIIRTVLNRPLVMNPTQRRMMLSEYNVFPAQSSEYTINHLPEVWLLINSIGFQF